MLIGSQTADCRRLAPPDRSVFLWAEDSAHRGVQARLQRLRMVELARDRSSIGGGGVLEVAPDHAGRLHTCQQSASIPDLFPAGPTPTCLCVSFMASTICTDTMGSTSYRRRFWDIQASRRDLITRSLRSGRAEVR